MYLLYYLSYILKQYSRDGPLMFFVNRQLYKKAQPYIERMNLIHYVDVLCTAIPKYGINAVLVSGEYNICLESLDKWLR